MRRGREYSDPLRGFSSALGSGLRGTVLLVIGAAVLTGAISLFLPKSYRAEAVILPNVQSSTGSSLLGLASGSGFGSLLSGALGGGENPVLTYPEILRSRYVMERTLLSLYPLRSGTGSISVMEAIDTNGGNERERLDNGIRALRQLAEVRANPRSGLISVSAVTRDSVLSAHIVSGMLAALNTFNVESRASQGQATREFLEKRLEEARGELVVAERALASFRQSNLRIGNSPQLLLEQARLEREVDDRLDLYRLLARQFELARVEETRDTPTFSVIEPATPPVRKHRPQVLLNTLVAAMGALGLRVLSGYLRPDRIRLEPAKAVAS
jgi:tyrosine-protein kinase Etk/Wzc